MIDKKMLHVSANNSNECNCPNCNGENLYYTDSDFNDWGAYIYKFVCEDCGVEGEKIYNLVFNGYTYYQPDNEN